MKLTILTTAFVIALAFSAPIGASDQTQSEMNQEACEKYKKADAELNRIYRQVLRDYAGDKNFVQKLKLAQQAWLAFRDAHLNSIYSDPGTYGSANQMCRCIILTELTEDRIKSLREWADGTQEGDVCAGSRKFKK